MNQYFTESLTPNTHTHTHTQSTNQWIPIWLHLAGLPHGIQCTTTAVAPPKDRLSLEPPRVRALTGAPQCGAEAGWPLGRTRSPMSPGCTLASPPPPCRQRWGSGRCPGLSAQPSHHHHFHHHCYHHHHCHNRHHCHHHHHHLIVIPVLSAMLTVLQGNMCWTPTQQHYFIHIINNNNNVHLSCAHQHPECSHDTY